MSVYARFKKSPTGFRQLVELLESTPHARRLKMIEVGMEEDPAYTQQALECMMTFEDVIHLPDLELAEVVAKAPPRVMAYSLRQATEEIRTRFLRNAKPVVAAELKGFMDVNIGPREIGGAQLKMVEVARGLEKMGRVRSKRIPF
jgi:flagellar motor switch protein FliG